MAEYCCYCRMNISNSRFATTEHIIPRSKGGNESKHNKRRCCKGCNSMRDNMDLEIFQAHIKLLIVLNPDDKRLLQISFCIEQLMNYVRFNELKMRR